MEKGNLQKLMVVFVISPLKQQTHIKYFAKTCRFKWIESGKIKTRS